MRNKEQKRERIVRAAARVFAERGYTRTTISRIAQEAGVGKGTVYEYFSSKEELFFAVFEWLMQVYGIDVLKQIAVSQASVAKRLQSMAETLLGQWLEMLDFYSLVMEFWSASAALPMRDRFKQAFDQAYKEFRAVVASLLRQGMEKGELRADIDPDGVAAVLVGSFDALLLQAWFDKTFQPVEAARGFLDALFTGLLVTPGG